MEENISNFLKQICIMLCGVELNIINYYPIDKKSQTMCMIYPYLDVSWIQINEAQLDVITLSLLERNFSMEYTLLEVLLHEIAHYKQYKQAMKRKKWFKVIRYIRDHKKRYQYHEDVADRYAHYCLKIIVRNIKNGTIH